MLSYWEKLCEQKPRGPAGRSCTPWYASEPAAECETGRHQLPPPVGPSVTYHLPGAAQRRGCCSACHLHKVAALVQCSVACKAMNPQTCAAGAGCQMSGACQAKQSAGRQSYLHLMHLGRPAAADLQQRPVTVRTGGEHLNDRHRMLKYTGPAQQLAPVFKEQQPLVEALTGCQASRQWFSPAQHSQATSALRWPLAGAGSASALPVGRSFQPHGP